MGVAVINALMSAGVGIYHFCIDHSTALLVLAYFAAMKSPEKIPFTPQAFWTWGRDTAQAIAETKTLPRPTQPAPTVPEPTKTNP